MAQLVEQRIRNAWVPGSSPGIGSNILFIIKATQLWVAFSFYVFYF